MHLMDIKELYKHVEEYSLSSITEKYCNDCKIDSEKGKKIETEIKKFLFLSRVYQSGYTIPKALDEYWHTFLLHTEIYKDFCESVLGKFIHHKPGLSNEDQATLRYIRFLVDYFRHFKQPPPFDIWPMSEDIFGENPQFELTSQCIAPCVDIGCGIPH